MASTDAQAVWKELSEHMRTSSKGASEKRRLTQYVTNTVLDDNFKGTTEQFVLHFNEQFRQLEEISEDDERLPPTVKLTLLQTAVRSINDLRIVETLDEFQSTTQGHGSSTSLSYDTYYDLLINACVRYDKTKKANIGKRRNVYATNIDDTYIDSPTPCIDHVPDSPYGCIDLPPDEFYQVHALSSRHPPSQRPGQPSRPPFRPQSQHPRPTKPIRRYDGPIFLPPQIYKLLSEDAMKVLKSYNTEAITRFHQRKVHNTEIVETPRDDPPGPPVPENDPPDLPESDLDIPDDPILDFVNSQCHNSEDLDQALQAYQAYQVPSPQDSTMTPERSINHHFTYHIAQATQAKHGSLVDRGANPIPYEGLISKFIFDSKPLCFYLNSIKNFDSVSSKTKFETVKVSKEFQSFEVLKNTWTRRLTYPSHFLSRRLGLVVHCSRCLAWLVRYGIAMAHFGCHVLDYYSRIGRVCLYTMYYSYCRMGHCLSESLTITMCHGPGTKL